MILFTILLLVHYSDAVATCFSLPATPLGASAYIALDCGGAMPVDGYAVGTQCSIPADCTAKSLSSATCLDGGASGEGYWSQPVCSVDVNAGFTTTQNAGSTDVTVAANTEYAALVHLNSVLSTTHVQLSFASGFFSGATSVTLRIYTLQDPVGASAGPGDLIYTTVGSIAGTTAGTVVSTSTGTEVVTTLNAGAGTITVILPTPLTFGNDFYVSLAFDGAGLVVPMECAGGAAHQYWSRTGSNAFVASNVNGAAGSTFGCVVTDVFVLDALPSQPTPCQPTLLTATIGYGDGNEVDNEPSMPYLDFTRSGFSGDSLDLKFTYATGVYDDVQFLPYSGAQVFGTAPLPVTGQPGAMPPVPPCGTTFQVFVTSSDNCQTTATIRADFPELVSMSGSTNVCGWTLSPSPVAYRGVLYSQWTGQIQVMTYQTVATLGSVTQRIKAAYANVVVRSPIVTSSATASPTSVTDAAVFQWTVSDQHLNTDSSPYLSITNIQTRTTAGYELSAAAIIVSGSTPTPWSLTNAGVLSSTSCSGTNPCSQAWSLSVQNADTGVCSLDATVTITYTTHCTSDLLTSGGCDSNVDNRQFVTTIVLSSVDFCKVVGGVTSLTMDAPTLHVATSSAGSSTSALSSLPSTPTLFAVGSSIGVHFTVSSAPTVPITVTSVSAKIYDANDRSHFSTYSDVTSTSTPYFFATSTVPAAGTAQGFFNLPTGVNGATTFTPWLLTNSGGVNSIIVSVTAAIQYDNIHLMGDKSTTFVTFEVPLSSLPKATASPLNVLASKINALPQSIQTGTITQETDIVQMQSAETTSAQSAMSTTTIAAVAAGSTVGVVVIVVVVIFVLKAAASSRAAVATYKSPVVAEPTVATGPSPSDTGFFAPRVAVPSNV